jgi:hypothetical protein
VIAAHRRAGLMTHASYLTRTSRLVESPLDASQHAKAVYIARHALRQR